MENKPNMYRLKAVQQFGGKWIGVYVKEGEWPEEPLLTDAEDALLKKPGLKRSSIIIAL